MEGMQSRMEKKDSRRQSARRGEDDNKTINNYNKSLYDNYLSEGKVPERHVKMNSFRTRFLSDEQPIHKKLTKTFIEEKATFTITPPNTNLQINRTIPLLTNLDEQDIFVWRDTFIETSNICGWNADTAVQVLHTLVHGKYFSIINFTGTAQNKLQALMEAKYPHAAGFSLFEQLTMVRQEAFYTISDYRMEISQICTKLGVTRLWTESEIANKIEDNFYHGLTDQTKLEMTRLNIQTFNQMYDLIRRTELMIIQQLKNLVSNKLNNKKSNLFKQDTKNKDKDIKYCKIHKSSTHNTDECRSNKKGKNNTQEPKKTYAVREPVQQSSTIELDVKINDIDIKALVDTGSTYNYISENFIEKAKIETKKLNLAASAEMANGAIVKITEECQVEFKIQGDVNTRYKDNFRILKTNVANVILGMEFLLKNDAKINLKSNTLVLDNKEYEILEDLAQTDTYHSTIADKTKLLHTKDNSNITDESIGKEELDALIKTFKKNNNNKLGLITGVEHEIKLVSQEIIKCKPYPVPHKLYGEATKMLKELENEGIIRKSISKFSSPAFLINKKNNKLRLVIDYRKLNRITEPFDYPLPKIQTYLQDLAGATIFTQIDLNSGYYQIKVKEEDIYKTAFCLCDDVFEFTRMPFGMSNAPRTFQRAMKQIFTGLSHVKIYLDDILIHSKNYEEHIKHLKEVFMRLENYKVSINFEKSHFAQTQVTYLGSIISADGIKPDISRVSLFNNFVPKNKRQLMKILGFVNWFRPFVPKLSLKTAKLHDKTKSDKTFVWTQAEQEIIQEILDDIKKQMLLNFPDFDAEFRLETDANEDALGSILYQKDRVIGVFSSKFHKSERNYTILEKETLAILKSLEHFKPIIFNCRVNIYTDNSNIITQSTLSRRLNRWKIIMEEYNYTLNHISGSKNIIADGLTRICSLTTLEEEKQIEIDWKTVVKMQQDLQVDNNLTTIKINDMKLITNAKNKIIIPDTYSRNFLQEMHTTLVHPGEVKFYLTLNKYFYIKNLKPLIKQINNACVMCQKNKIGKQYYGTVSGGLVSKSKNEVVSSDIFGPIKTKHFSTTKEKEYFYLLTITDLFSRWTEVAAIFDITAKTVVNELEKKFILKFGPPQKIITDQGRQYISKNFSDLMTKYGIKHSCTTSHNPTGNSVSERLNSQIAEICRIYKGSSIPTLLQKIKIRLNYTTNTSTDYTPFELIYKTPNFNLSKDNILIDEKSLFMKQMERIKKTEDKTNEQRKSHIFKANEFVYKKNFNNDKILDKWCGPYKIVKARDNHVWINEETKITKQNLKNIRPISQAGEDIVTLAI